MQFLPIEMKHQIAGATSASTFIRHLRLKTEG
jgi:hypothetical protein